MYWPSIGTLKSRVVPEESRATIYNLYRLPLNVIVLMPLLMNFSISTTFAVTTSILGVAVASAFILKSMPKKSGDLEMQALSHDSDA